MYQLTRLFGHKCPEDIKTGQPDIDVFLQTLDARLAGSAKVRKSTLEEVRDHLLEAQAALMRHDQSEATAAKQAVTEFGDVETHARVQRQGLYRSFWRTLAFTGSVFALLMTFFFMGDENIGGDWRFVAGIFALNFAFYGICMAYLMVFIFAPNNKGEQFNGNAPFVGSDLIEVQSTKKEKRYAVGMFVVMFGLGMTGILGLLDVGIFANVSPLYCIAIALLAFHNALGTCSAWNRLELTQTHLQVYSLTGRIEIPRSAICMVKKAPAWASYLYIGAGVLHWVYWKQSEGSQIKTQRKGLVLNQEMLNVDTLLATLHDDALTKQ